jgi:hypothetical protein
MLAALDSILPMQEALKEVQPQKSGNSSVQQIRNSGMAWQRLALSQQLQQVGVSSQQV